MPRAGQVVSAVDGPSGDLLKARLLSWAFPASLVDEAVREAGRAERRSRLLPARSVVYFSLAMWLFATDGYAEVMRRLVDGLGRKHQWARGWTVPSSAAIARARQRLGPRPLQLLFAKVAGRGDGRHGGRRLMALDSVALEVQDTPLNRAAYGRSRPGAGAPPRVRVAALAEVGAHAVRGAGIGPLQASAAEGSELLAALRAGDLLIAERGRLTSGSRRAAIASGCDLLLGEVVRCGSGEPAAPDFADLGEVRVVSYTLSSPVAGCAQLPGEVVRLITTVLDPRRAPAGELAWLFSTRWRMRMMLEELGAPGGDGRPVLRSKSPEMVEQEIWAMFLAHHAVRELLVSGDDGGTTVDRAAFNRSLILL